MFDPLLHLSIYFCIYAILAMSLNLVAGYCGLLTLAHAAYFAIGAYCYGLVALQLDWGFLPAVVACIVVAMFLSLAVSLPSWRFRGDLFVIVSLAVQALALSAFQNWHSADAPLGSWTNLTNGPFGIPGIPKPSLFGWQADSLPEFLALAAGTAALCGLVVWRLVSSPWGRLLKCLRDDELVLIAILEILRFANFPDAIAANLRLLLYGALLILMTHFRPQGLAGEYRFR